MWSNLFEENLLVIDKYSSEKALADNCVTRGKVESKT